MRKNCPNTEFFWSVLSLNTRKYGPEKTPYLDAFLAVKAEQEKPVKLQAFDSSYFRVKSHYEDDGTQNYLVFRAIYKYFEKIANSDHISA